MGDHDRNVMYLSLAGGWLALDPFCGFSQYLRDFMNYLILHISMYVDRQEHKSIGQYHK